MISLLGYNFAGDVNALDAIPVHMDNITSTTIKNGLMYELNVTKDTSFDYTTALPTGWDDNTIMSTDFDGNIQAGNLTGLVESITSIRIKRRVKGETEWITIHEMPVTDVSDLSFVIADNLNLNYTDYEYAWVPMSQSIEGEYTIQEITSQFDGVYVCDADSIYKFYEGVQYGATDTIQQIGVFAPLGRAKPVVISNGITNYDTGELSGMVMPSDYLKTGKIDRQEIVQRRKEIVNFFTNKRAKIIKDWNNNAWLVICTGNPNTSYENNYGMGLVTVSMPWTEIGDPKSREDLYEAGLIPTEV